MTRVINEAMDDPQVHANAMVVEIEHPRLGPMSQMGLPIALSETPGRARAVADRDPVPLPPDPSGLEDAESGSQGPVDPISPLPPPLSGVRVLEITNVIAGPTAGKLLADLGPSMRLTISGLQGKQSGTANQASSTVVDEMPQLGGIPSYPWSSAGFTTTGEFSGINMLGESGGHLARSTIYGTDRYAVTDVTRNQFGAALTHTLNPRTFYRVSLNWMKSNYDSEPNSRRDELKNEFVNNGNAVDSLVGVGGTYYLDTAPFGWTSSGTSSPGSGLRLGGHWARARDASVVTLTTLKFDLTNQTTQFSSLKAGVEIILSDFDMDYGSDDSVIVHLDRSKQKWQRTSTQAAFYVQEKLEFKGMIANVGLRLDSFNPGGDWWVYDDFDRQFVTKGLQTRDIELKKEAIEGQLTLSPRVGVSFPITTDSKLFFNYGHFRDVLAQRELYQIQTQWLGNIGNLGDPNQPLLKTVSYELGYEQSIFDQYLLRLSGYYNDRSNQPGEVNFISIDGAVNYNVNQARNYGDTRGVEITLNKTRGQWFRGFINYTFMTEKSGNFGFRRQYENPVEESDYVRTSTEHYQNTPVSMPFARTDLEFIAPATLGLLGDWRLNLLAGWRAGQVFTWDGGGQAIRGLSNNVRQKNFTSLDLRLSKNFQTGLGRAQFFVDITNVLNLRHMYFNANARQPFEAFDDERPDWLDYMWSLHMPVEVFEDIDETLVPYIFIAGDDRPGDFRKDGVAFVPIEVATEKGNLPTQDDMGTLESGRRVLGWVAGNNFGDAVPISSTTRLPGPGTRPTPALWIRCLMTGPISICLMRSIAPSSTRGSSSSG
ncbi:MAG: TonB-dependent receptor [Candidatus Marinimicrobia bacterium]|nr:TonB-dependent receptor [Candidatus Neomarinimicrobiota bacterium]